VVGDRAEDGHQGGRFQTLPFDHEAYHIHYVVSVKVEAVQGGWGLAVLSELEPESDPEPEP
jgi:hypothetical protein